MKDYRNAELKIYVIGNILIILLLSGVFSIVFSNIATVDKDTLGSYKDIISALLGSALLSSVLYIYVFIFDSLVPSKWKDFIAYFPCGRPGNTVFTKIKDKNVDARFTQEDAKTKYKAIYDELDRIKDSKRRAAYQNSKWYGIYQSIETNETIALSQKDFLLNRDMCSITVVILIIYVLIGKVSGFYSIQCNVIFWLVGEGAIINLAAKSKAKRFVYNVIAKDIHAKSDIKEENSDNNATKKNRGK